jgi:hypothetical protein
MATNAPKLSGVNIFINKVLVGLFPSKTLKNFSNSELY